ncbi:MAG TPA: hypothetical protein VFR70_10970 [Flavobacterium sp.]|nr:hypothetical protein [Flavobacterium sp.]
MSKEMISTHKFSQIVAGFRIVGCAVRRRDFFYLLLREDFEQWTDYKNEGNSPGERHLEKRMAAINLTKTDPWGLHRITGFGLSAIGSSTQPEEKGVMATLDGQVYATGGGSNGIETDVPRSEDGLRAGGFQRLKTIDGRLYACGGYRSLGVRLGTNSWRWFSAQFEYPPTIEGSSIVREPAGFEDVDGFSANDIYLVGGYGDVWHFDGTRARRIDFPSDLPLYAVCCGADGQVYIGGYGGCAFVGRGDSWHKIKSRPTWLYGVQMVWYDGKVWATNDQGVWWVDKNGIVEAEIPLEARLSRGHISVNDGVLLLGGSMSVAYLQDGKWTQIYSYRTMMERCRDEGKLDGVMRARWHEFSKRRR